VKVDLLTLIAVHPSRLVKLGRAGLGEAEGRLRRPPPQDWASRMKETSSRPRKRTLMTETKYQ
jgi:hypothetical protein